MVDWADKAMCYRWLHAKSNYKLSKINTYFTIPVIIMSTITGTANFAQQNIPERYRSEAIMIIGGLNLLSGLITKKILLIQELLWNLLQNRLLNSWKKLILLYQEEN